MARDWALGLRLNNVADRRYETALGYNQPGREAYLTLRWAPR
jgi:vitamin B12 transporter